MTEIEKAKIRIIEFKIIQTLCLWLMVFFVWKELLFPAILIVGVVSFFTNEMLIRLIEELNKERSK